MPVGRGNGPKQKAARELINLAVKGPSISLEFIPEASFLSQSDKRKIEEQLRRDYDIWAHTWLQMELATLFPEHAEMMQKKFREKADKRGKED